MHDVTRDLASGKKIQACVEDRFATEPSTQRFDTVSWSRPLG
jgi:hypothetical protein